MTDYYMKLCTGIYDLTDEESKWIEAFLERKDLEDLFGENGELYDAAKAWFEERQLDPDNFDDDGYWPYFDWRLDAATLVISDDGGAFEFGHVRALMQCFLTKFRPSKTFKLEWAHTASRAMLDAYGGGWAVIGKDWIEHGDTFKSALEAKEHHKDPWSNDLVQFARLIDEIRATQDITAMTDLCASMDLSPEEVDELFDRAHKLWGENKP